MKIKSIFLFPGYFLNSYVQSWQFLGPFHGLVHLLKETWYHRRYSVFTPYLKANLATTKELSSGKDSIENEPGPYTWFLSGLRKVNLPAHHISFLDIGCGTGRFIGVAIQLGFPFVAGIDLDKEGLKIAEQNALLSQRKSRSPSKYVLTFADAAYYEIPPEINLIYFFNPFGPVTMERVINNILNSHAGRKRDIYIIYAFPKFEDLFLANGFNIEYSEYDKKRKTLSVLKLPLAH